MIIRVLWLFFFMLTACSESPSNYSLHAPKANVPQQLSNSKAPVVTTESTGPTVMSCISDISSRKKPANPSRSSQALMRRTLSHAAPAVSLMRIMVDEDDLPSDPFSDKDVVVFADQEAVIKYVNAVKESANDTGQSMIAIHLRSKSIDTFCLDQQKSYWQSKKLPRKSASLIAPAVSEASSINADKYDKALRLMTRLYNSIHDLLEQVSADELTETIARNHLNTQFSLPKSDFNGL